MVTHKQGPHQDGLGEDDAWSPELHNVPVGEGTKKCCLSEGSQFAAKTIILEAEVHIPGSENVFVPAKSLNQLTLHSPALHTSLAS